MKKIGLIAGNRKLPILFSQSAKKKGYSVVAIAVKGDTSAQLPKCVDKAYWLGLDQFSRMFEIFRAEGVTQVVMAGQISPVRLFSKEVSNDGMLKELLESIRDQRADTIFGAIGDKLKTEGFELIDSTPFFADFFPAQGALTKTAPNFAQWEDIYFGWEMAKAIACLDIGQTVAVKNKAIVAVEALEGTDNLIRRAGWIARSGFTVVKVSKPAQDLRFDVPVIGLNTIKNLIRSKAACLAVEAGKTIFIDREEGVALAEKKHFHIVAL